MILPDLNLLIFAYDRASPQHEAARSWLFHLLESGSEIGMTWIFISGFIRISAHPKILKNPLTVGESIKITRAWLEHDHIFIIEPGSKFQECFLSGIERDGTAGNLTTDAYLAALAIEHDAELHSCDSDFQRFTGLRWCNPLIP